LHNFSRFSKIYYFNLDISCDFYCGGACQGRFANRPLGFVHFAPIRGVNNEKNRIGLNKAGTIILLFKKRIIETLINKRFPEEKNAG